MHATLLAKNTTFDGNSRDEKYPTQMLLLKIQLD